MIFVYFFADVKIVIEFYLTEHTPRARAEMDLRGKFAKNLRSLGRKDFLHPEALFIIRLISLEIRDVE